MILMVFTLEIAVLFSGPIMALSPQPFQYILWCLTKHISCKFSSA